jgi:CheY-like chemotaxis protein
MLVSPQRCETVVDQPDTKKKILVVDDDETNRLVVRALMERRGYIVVEADSGQTALDTIKTDDFDFILMDLSMPGMDGFETTRRLRSVSDDLDNLPIFALTAHTSRKDVEKCLEAGLNGVLPKPFDSHRADQLLSLINAPSGGTAC